jgi:hypothetical protein
MDKVRSQQRGHQTLRPSYAGLKSFVLIQFRKCCLTYGFPQIQLVTQAVAAFRELWSLSPGGSC